MAAQRAVEQVRDGRDQRDCLPADLAAGDGATLNQLCAEAEKLLRHSSKLISSARGDLMLDAEASIFEAARHMKTAIEHARAGQPISMQNVADVQTANQELKQRVDHAIRFHEGLLQALGAFVAGYTRGGATPEICYQSRVSIEG